MLILANSPGKRDLPSVAERLSFIIKEMQTRTLKLLRHSPTINFSQATRKNAGSPKIDSKQIL